MRLHGFQGEIEIRRIRNGREDLVLKQPMRSFTRWFKHFIVDFMTGMGTKGFNLLPVPPTTGELYYPFNNDYIYKYHIIDHVGIGNRGDAFDPNQTNLAGFLMYETGKTVSIQTGDTDGTTLFELAATFQITFTDTIRETGLYGICYMMQDPQHVIGWRNFLVSRDVLSSPVDVSPGDVLIVRYRISVS
jgi:hypothetical protein